MIHIDDLVRSRLQGAEEKERAGAWANMRGLLDTEMPAAVAEGAGNRRLYGLLLLLLIGTSLTVGGYQWATHYYNHGSSSIGAESEELASSAKIYSPPSVAVRASKAKAGLDAITNNSQASQNLNAYSASSSSIGMSHPPASIPHSSSSPQHDQDNVQPVAAIISTAAANNQASSASGNASSAATSGNGKGIIAPAQPVTSSSVTAAISTPNTANNYAAGSNNQLVTPDGLHLLLRRDSMQRIEIAEHRVRNGYERMSTPATLYYDTISMQMIAVYQPLQPVITAGTATASRSMHQRKSLSVGNTKTASAKAANIKAESAAPSLKSAQSSTAEIAAQPVMQASAAAASTAADGSNLVSLASLKVSSVKHNWWNPEQFSAMINKVQYRIAGIHMTGGIEAGINGSLGNGVSLGGFECGLTALIVINDFLSLNSGLYYYQRYNTGATIHDNYVYADPAAVHSSPLPINGVIYNHYSWLEDSVDHHYNYDKIQTLELPVLLRYGAGRFFGEAGLNLVYAFKMKANEITIHADHVNQQQANYPTTLQPAFGTSPLVTPDDFGSRFGFGFAAGGGYHFSPAVTLNLRISKTVWDNAKTDGSRKISSDLYKLPSLQLSVGYRFSQQKASRSGDQ